MTAGNTLHKELFALQDKEYRDFTAKLTPSIDKEKIIGVRVPVLRKFAKEFYKNKCAAEEFLSALYNRQNKMSKLLKQNVQKI